MRARLPIFKAQFQIALIRFDRAMGETWLGLMSVVYGLWFMIWPDVYSTSQAWAQLAKQVDEDVYGGAALVLGALLLIFLGIGNKTGWQIVTFISIGYWIYTTLVIMSVTPWGVAVPIFTMIAGLHFWTFIRAGVRDEQV